MRDVRRSLDRYSIVIAIATLVLGVVAAQSVVAKASDAVSHSGLMKQVAHPIGTSVNSVHGVPATVHAARSPVTTASVTTASTRLAATLPYKVNVAYADDLRPNPKNFPTPWWNTSNTSLSFFGCQPSCSGWDSGAVEVVNTSSSAMTISAFSITYALSTDTTPCVYQIWNSDLPATIQSGDEAVFTENATGGGNGCSTSQGYMDSSDIGPNGEGYSGNCTESGIIPKVGLTVNGTASTFSDTTQVLNTGGVDQNSCKNPITGLGPGNESYQWTPIGTTPANGLLLTATPATQSVSPVPTAGTATITAKVTNGSGTALSGVPVNLAVTAGPNQGESQTVNSDSTGKAVFIYHSTEFGIDHVQVSVSNPSGSIDAAPQFVYWQNATLRLSPGGGLPGASISYTGTGFASGEAVKLYMGSATGVFLASATATSTGAITGTFTVPVPTGGAPISSVVAIGQTSSREGWALFNAGCTTDWNNSAGGSFNTASDWTGGAVPGSSDLACIILPGTYTVDMTQSNTVGSLVLGSGSTGAQTLEVPGANSFLTLNGPSSIQKAGVFDLGSADGNSSGLNGVGPLTNNGTLSTSNGNGGSRYIRTSLTNNASGIVAIANFNTLDDQNVNITNDGKWTVAPGGGFSVTGGGSFTQANGTLTTNNGVYVQSSTFAATKGTVTGQVVLNNSTLADQAAKGTYVLECGDSLTGTIPTGQLVNVQGNGCGNATTTLTGTSVTNDGTLEMDSTDDNYSLIQGSPLTNKGTLTTVTDNGGTRYIRINLTNGTTGKVTISDFDTRVDQNFAVTNNGTFTVANGGGLSFTGGGTFTQAAGTLTASAPGDLYVQSGTLDLSGGTLAGQPTLNNSTLNDTGTAGGTPVLECSDSLSGTIPSGQVVNVQGNGCGSAATTLSGTSVTNNGTLEMDSTDGNYSLLQGSPLINTGTFSTVQDNGGTRYIRVNVTNQATGTINIGDFDSRMDQNFSVANSGTFNVSGTGGFNDNGGGSFTQQAGTFTNSGSAAFSSGTFTFAGGQTAGGELNVNGSETFNDNTSGAGSFAFHNSNAFSAATLDGSGNIVVASGQVIDLRDDCTGENQWSPSAGVDLSGKLLVSSGGACGGYNVFLTVPGHGLNVLSGGSVTVNPASLSSATGTLQLTGSASVASGGQFTIAWPFNQNGSAVTNNGTVSVGDGGTWSMNNGASYTNGSSGTLSVVADANAKAGFGISGSGANTLAGILSVTTVGTPATGNTFTVISGNSRTGTFSTINSSVAYTPNYTSTGLTLQK